MRIADNSVCTRQRLYFGRWKERAELVCIFAQPLPINLNKEISMGSQSVGSQVVWFDVPCVDLDRAIAFYSAVLGCKVDKQEGPGFSMGILPHEGAAVGGCLVATKDNRPSDHGILIYLNCNGRLDEAVSQVQSHGGSILEPKHSIGPHGHRALIRDSEGNRVALHSM
jgi:predicted enzyme related to lactoylglutathione lyase